MTENKLDAQIEQAKVNQAIANTLELRAKSVVYDRKAEKLIILLTNNATYYISPRLLEGLHYASLEKVEDFHLSGDGSSIHWESLDVDFSIPGIIAGRFGSETWMEQLNGEYKPPLDRLKQALVKLKESDDIHAEEAHQLADSALLLYINDAEVTRLFESIERWYS